MTRDYGLEAHQAAEKHLEACYDGLDEAEFAEGEAEWPDMAGPFCGCSTCVVREVLHAAWPILLEATKADNTNEGVR